MSRLFEALRRTELGKNGGVSGALAEGSMNCQELLVSLEREQPTAGQVARVVYQPHLGDHIAGRTQDSDIVAEKFKILRYRLSHLRQYKPVTSLLLTSSIPREGKTTVAVNLAVSLAMTSSRVLLVDADLRRPHIHTTLGLGPLPGLADFLEARLELAAAYRRVDPFGFLYLPAGRLPSKPFELLQSSTMRDFVKQAACGFDWVVIDSPPLIPFADAQCLAALTDAVLMVIRDGLTPREDFRRSLKSLRDVNVAGVVLNGTESCFSDRYYYSYYKAPSCGALKVSALA